MTEILTAENIDKTSENIADFLSKNGLKNKEVLRIRMMSEEILIKYLSLSGDGARFRVVTEKKFGQLRVSLRVSGECINPFGDDDDEAHFLRNITRDMEVMPVWNYSHGYNSVVFSIPLVRKIPDYVFILGATVLSIILGLAAKIFLGDTCNDLCNDYLSPVSDAIMGLIGSTSIIMIFVSIISGVCGMGDIATFKSIGKKMAVRYGAFLVGCTAVCLMGLVLCFDVTTSGGGSANPSVLWKMIVGIIPTNVFQAFLDGNTLQVIFLAVISAIILLILSSKTQGLTDWIMQANFYVQGILEIIIKAMPVIVFVSIFKIVSSSELDGLVKVYKYPLTVVSFDVLLLIFSLLSVVIRFKVSPKVMIKKALPAFLIALSTASSSATFTDTMETSEKNTGSRKNSAMWVSRSVRSY